MATTTETVANGTSRAKKKDDKGRWNDIGGFFVKRLDPKVIAAFAKDPESFVGADADEDDRDAFLKAVPDGGLDADVGDDESTAEQAAVALSQWFLEHTPKPQQVKCAPDEGGCGAISSELLRCCPFCGDGDGVDAAGSDPAESSPDVTTAPTPAPESAPDATPPPAPESAPDAAVAAGEPITTTAPSPKKAAAAKATAKKPTTAKEGTTMQTTADTNGKAAKAAKPSTALAKAGSTALDKLTEKDLDQAVAAVQKLKAAGIVAYWMFGQKLLDIFDRQLWKLRVDAAGKRQFSSFEAFATHELGMSTAHAYNALDAARHYKSPDEIRELGGATKAVLILKAAPEDQPRLREQAKAGASTKQMRAEVKESRKKHGSPKKSPQAKAGAKSGAKKAASSEKITVASIEGSRTIRMFRKPDVVRADVDLSELKRAQALGDVPFGIEELPGGVKRFYSVVKTDKGLVLNIQTRRAE